MREEKMTLKEVLETLEEIKALLNKLEKKGEICIVLDLLSAGFSSFEDESTTPEICLQTISLFYDMNGGNDGLSYSIDPLDFIPKKFLTQDFFVKLLDSAPFIFEYLPKTRELCLLAVSKEGYLLKYVPNIYKTEELCVIAVKQYAKALEYVPENLKTRELCYMAVKKNGYALKYTPNEYKTNELCAAVVKENAYALRCVPEHLKTQELCLKAVNKTGLALEYVPEKFKTPEVCFIAIKHDAGGETLDYVPENIKTQEICLLAVAEYGCALKYVPDHLKTIKICVAAVQNSNRALGFVPPEIVEQVLEAVRNTEEEKL